MKKPTFTVHFSNDPPAEPGLYLCRNKNFIQIITITPTDIEQNKRIPDWLGGTEWAARLVITDKAPTPDTSSNKEPLPRGATAILQFTRERLQFYQKWVDRLTAPDMCDKPEAAFAALVTELRTSGYHDVERFITEGVI